MSARLLCGQADCYNRSRDYLSLTVKILLLHPDDNPLSGPWLGSRWDAVFDLARSGWAACERWSRMFDCAVKPIDSLRDAGQIRRVRELLQLERGRLLDEEGLDWWELSALLVHQNLEGLVLLRRFVEGLPPGAQVSITRDGLEARALRYLLGKRLQVFSQVGQSSTKGLRHYWSRLRLSPSSQIMETLGDKYDAGYHLRRHWHRRRSCSRRPVVLIPSAYVNVSLIGIGYAQLLPDVGFLLVSTRRSGRLQDVPRNVEQTWLASYAIGTRREQEYRYILERWERLKEEIEAVPELAMLSHLGLVDSFPSRFADGLAIRDAWRQVLDTEQVSAVLCGDDSNPYTHIPLLLAAKRGLPTMVCHHGALDGRYMIKTSHADVIFAKGRLEYDYLVNTCEVNPTSIEIGAPGAPSYLRNLHQEVGGAIVFFSEPYEMSAGRTEEIYRDILPGLVNLAGTSGRRLVVKLHPSENLQDRREMAQKILQRRQMHALVWATGPLQPKLMEDTWFGVTVFSSVVLDCAVRGVPCFYCDWLDLWPYEYVRQYRKFGVGVGLKGPEEIAKIPDMLATFRSDRQAREDCWDPMTPGRFRELLGRADTAAMRGGSPGTNAKSRGN